MKFMYTAFLGAAVSFTCTLHASSSSTHLEEHAPVYNHISKEGIVIVSGAGGLQFSFFVMGVRNLKETEAAAEGSLKCLYIEEVPSNETARRFIDAGIFTTKYALQQDYPMNDPAKKVVYRAKPKQCDLLGVTDEDEINRSLTSRY